MRTWTTNKWAFCAFCCFAGGIGAGIVGSVLTSLSWIIGAEVHPFVRAVGTVLLILTIPLLILAGHCLDRLEQDAKKFSASSGSLEKSKVSSPGI